MRLFAFLIAAVSFTAPLAFAYVPPSEFIVKGMVRKHGGLKGIRLRTQVTAIEAGRPLETNFKALTAFDPASRTLRSWAIDASGAKLYAMERKSGNFTMAENLLLEPAAGEVTKELLKAGVPVRTEQELLALPDEEQRRTVEVLSLKRWKGTPSWVIGKPDKSDPQLWVEKDSFLPLRFVFKSGSALGELNFEAYQHTSGFPYPRSLFALNDEGAAMLREDVVEIAVTPVAAEMKGPLAVGFTEAGNAAPSAVRRLIEEYYKTIR